MDRNNKGCRREPNPTLEDGSQKLSRAGTVRVPSAPQTLPNQPHSVQFQWRLKTPLHPISRHSKCDSDSGFFSWSMGVIRVADASLCCFCVGHFPQHGYETWMGPVTISTESSPGTTPTETISEQVDNVFFRPVSSGIRLGAEPSLHRCRRASSDIGQPLGIRCTLAHFRFTFCVLLSKLRVSGFVINLPEYRIRLARATVRSCIADVRASQRLPSRMYILQNSLRSARFKFLEASMG